MTDREENAAGQAEEGEKGGAGQAAGAKDAAMQWAEKRLVLLEEAGQYEEDLSALTGSCYKGDLKRLSRMDHYGQAELLEMLFEQSERRASLSDQLGVEVVYGLLFAGPSGCGKMTTAEHLVGNLKKMGYTRLAALRGVRLGSRSRKKAVRRMRAVLGLASEDAPLVLLLEQLSDNPWAGELYDILLEFVEEQGPGVLFPILIERDAAVFSAALKRDFLLISFSLPSLEDRKNYIRLHQNVEVVYEDDGTDGEAGEDEPFSYKVVFEGITPEEIAAETEGFSYAGLRQLTEYMKVYLTDILVRDNVPEQYACERVQEEGYYKVKGHMVRQAVAMLRERGGGSAGGPGPEAWGAGLEPVIRLLSQAELLSGLSQTARPAGQAQGADPAAGLTLSEIEQKVKIAAEGGPKDARALALRYREQVYQTDEFGKVDERLANASDEYDEEE